MIFLGILSIVLLIATSIGLIAFYKYRNKKNKSVKKVIVSRKAFRKETEDTEKFIQNAEKTMINLINEFIVRSKEKFNDEPNYENKSKVLEDIKIDIQQLTNSFTWKRIQDIPELKKRFEKEIDFLKKQRPSKWKEIVNH